jgi:riboflavin synthase
MFTGIIEETGRVESLTPIAGGLRLTLTAPLAAADAGLGDSIAVDGCCLTVSNVAAPRLEFELSGETLRRTVAAGYRAGSRVNLERSLRVGDRMGGHFVTGHVDTVATVKALRPEGGFATLEIELDETAFGLVAEKGSIGVNGVSLTVAAWTRTAAGGLCTVALIPATLDRTNLGEFVPGTRVNIEYDLVARYLKEMRDAAGTASPPGATA